MNDLVKLSIALVLTCTAIVLLLGTLAAVIVFSIETLEGDHAGDVLVIGLSLYAITVLLGRVFEMDRAVSKGRRMSGSGKGPGRRKRAVARLLSKGARAPVVWKPARGGVGTHPRPRKSETEGDQQDGRKRN